MTKDKIIISKWKKPYRTHGGKILNNMAQVIVVEDGRLVTKHLQLEK